MVDVKQLLQIRRAATATATGTYASRCQPAGDPQVVVLGLEGDVPVDQPEEGLVLQLRDAGRQGLELLLGDVSGQVADATAKRHFAAGECPGDPLDGVDQLDLVLVELTLVNG